jgi:uncharacterized RDD family membrane protein YckC
MFCANCGTQLATGARYCSNCGAATAAAAMPVQPQGVTAPHPPAAPEMKPRPDSIAMLDPSITLCSAWRRLGAYLLDLLLAVVTLLIGWLVWSIIVWQRGQTPAKQLLGMRVLNRETGRGAGGWKMFAREIPCKWVVGLAANITLVGWVMYFWLLWDAERQELWDKMVNTVVVNDPGKLLDPRDR